MKTLIFLLISVILLTGCKKEDGAAEGAGVVSFSITYETPSGPTRKSASVTDATGFHTQFGDYITSVTPAKFTAKFRTIRFYDEKLIENGGHICELVDNNAPADDPARFADFTGSATVKMVPVLWGTTGNDGNFTQKEVSFIYFTFWGPVFYQEADLPSQYNGIDLTQFNRMYNNTVYISQSVKPAARLTVDCFPLIYNIFREEDGGFPFRYIFGNTDATKVVYPQQEQTSPLLAPFGYLGINPFVWSEKFSGFTLVAPDFGETRTIDITLGFDITDLIQIYAGTDNVPYTQDDVIVYAPNFWERISAAVDIN